MMKQQDRETLAMLLTELIAAQDTVTHLNERGQQCEIQARDAIAIRNGVRNRIIAFVDGLVNTVTVQQSADTVTGTVIGMKIDRLG